MYFTHWKVRNHVSTCMYINKVSFLKKLHKINRKIHSQLFCWIHCFNYYSYKETEIAKWLRLIACQITLRTGHWSKYLFVWNPNVVRIFILFDFIQNDFVYVSQKMDVTKGLYDQYLDPKLEEYNIHKENKNCNFTLSLFHTLKHLV